MRKTSILINRPSREVWSFFTNTKNWKNWWSASLIKIEPGWRAGATLIWENRQTSDLTKLIDRQEIQLSSRFMEITFQLRTVDDNNTLVEYEFEPIGGASFNDGGREHLATINANLIKLKECIERKKIARYSKKCWFCSTNTSTPKSGYEAKMHRSLGVDWFQSDIVEGDIYMRYEIGTVTVPRCERCEKSHANQDPEMVVAGIVKFLVPLIAIGSGILSGILAGKIIPGNITIFNVMVGIVFGIAIGILSDILLVRLVPKVDPSIKRKELHVDYRPIKQKLKKGWRLGSKPVL